MATCTEIIDLSSDDSDCGVVIEIPKGHETSGTNKGNEKKVLEINNGSNVNSSSNSSEVQIAGTSSQNSFSTSQKDAIKKLLAVIKPVVKKPEREKIAAKINRKIDSLAKNTDITEDFQKILIDKFEKATEIISSNSKKVWTELNDLFKIMTPDRIRELAVDVRSNHQPPNPVSRSDAKMRKNIIKLEVKLQKLEEDIKKYDESEVDMEDEINSAYLVKTRMINHYMRHWDMLCELQNFSKSNTGRPIHKKISFEDVTKFPEINEAVFNFLNSRLYENSYYFPDFHDILNVVECVKNKSSIFLADFEIRNIAKNFFEHIVQILQKRRGKDFRVAINLDNVEDPAESDPELLKKLEENRLQAKNEDDVIQDFVQKQGEMRLEAVEVEDEDPDVSPPASDGENEIDEGVDSESNVEIDLESDDDETDFESNEPSQNGTNAEKHDKETSDDDNDSNTEVCKKKKPRLDVT